MGQTDGLPSCSVVVCAYTAARWLDLCAAVASITRQTVRPLEIVLVADHNRPLFERMLAELGEYATVVENTRPTGLSGARNSGVAACRANVVAFLDDDAMASEDWLERLLPYYADAATLGVGGAVHPLWQSGAPDWFPLEFAWVVGCSYRGLPAVVAPVRNLLGCNMSFRREIFALAGGFRSGLGRLGTTPLGCEETEFCIRAAKHWPGGVVLYAPDAKVLHRVPDARGRFSYFRARCYAEGISKARVSRLVGSGPALASERAHVALNLPRGIGASLAKALRTRRLAPAARAGATVLGLMFAARGFARGLLEAPKPAMEGLE
ncbi:MAG TPA: glycosyltransferase [Chloroflexota bacterium]|nr:glycosyltransferase [Chloroflexota bacterium]